MCSGKVYTFFESDRPESCERCNSSHIWAHGHYPRKLWTIREWCLHNIIVKNKRWICVDCRHTSSIPLPDVKRRLRACNLVVVLLLWSYLASGKGLENCGEGPFYEFMYGKKISRYMRKAQKSALHTQQAIREVLMETIEPETWKNLFRGGLSPPPSLAKRQRKDPDDTITLWRAFAILLIGSTVTNEPCSILLSRAQERSTQTGRPFLI